MKVHEIPLEDIVIAPNRQRREFNYEKIVELAASITQNGLIQPVVVRPNEDGETVLVAGERRLKALEYIWNIDTAEVKCGEYLFPEGVVPCIMQNEMDEIDAFEMELEENVRRTDLTWQEKATATSQLFELRRLQDQRDGTEEPTVSDIASETRPDETPTNAHEATRQELILARNLSDPDVARASSPKEGMKILKRKEEARRNAEHGDLIGKTFNASMHTLLKGNCIAVMEGLPDEHFDVILTDPPYGIGADEFGDSGGKAAGAHFYNDSFDNWKPLMDQFSRLAYKLAKPSAHAYVFCDVDNFVILKLVMEAAQWKVFRTPLIWFNPGGFRAPWPTMGPQRKYQTILYAVKGDRLVTRLYSDVITYPSDENKGHPAQKPVAVYSDLLRRSIRPGDSVLDPFCGSGTIFPSAHDLKVKATGIEMDAAAYGLAAKRLGELK